MIKQLKYILNSFSDEELEEIELWVDSNTIIDQVVLEKLYIGYAINLITENAEVKINDTIDKERRVKETYEYDNSDDTNISIN